MIAEPTLEHYVYYLRQVAGDNSKAIQEHRAAFEEEVRGLLVHLERESGQAIPAWEWPQESQDRRVSQRIVRTDWLDNLANGRSYFVEARTYGDVYWLQVGYYRSGQAGPEVFAGLHGEIWQPLAMEHLLGSSSYLCGIVVASEMEELAAQAVAAYTGDIPSTIVSTHLANCCARLYGSHRYPYLTVLLYPNSECEKWAGQTILNDVGLRLELYKHKADRQLAWCEENLTLLPEQERLLRDLLEKVKGASPADLELWRQLIQLYRVFNGNVGMLAERQTTIDLNLENLEVVVEDLGPLAEDRLLDSVQDRLRRRQKQLEADLKFANQTRRQADAAIGALRVELALDRLVDLQAGRGDAVSIEPAGWAGAPPPVESEIDAITPHQKPSQPVIYPQINASPYITLTAEERVILEHVYRGFRQVLVEKEFGGGYGGARVLLALPVTVQGIPAARKVTKLGSAPELCRELDNYIRYVGPFLPHSTARVEWERYYERGSLAGLTYIFMGGGTLGQVTDLEETYRQQAPYETQRVIAILQDLLARELGPRWYGQTNPLHCFFAAEYSSRMTEHLRLRLRLESTDALWPVDQRPAMPTSHRQIEIEAIPREHETIQAGTLLSVEGMVVKRLKRDKVMLQDPDGQGIVVGVKFTPESGIVQELELDSRVGVRGEVVYNRRGRMEQIVCDAFPGLAPGVGSESIELPGVPGTYPNPLRVYPHVLGSVLAGRQSYVHGDLHLRNVLVDEWGKSWLIDFALVGERHNLFDFIKLETYVRLAGLVRGDHTFSLGDYVRFEEALTAVTLGRDGLSPLDDPHLLAAYEVILSIRRIARNYMARESGFLTEYFPALFLYCLSVMKYYRADAPQPTRLAFATASVLSRHLLGMAD